MEGHSDSVREVAVGGGGTLEGRFLSLVAEDTSSLLDNAGPFVLTLPPLGLPSSLSGMCHVTGTTSCRCASLMDKQRGRNCWVPCSNQVGGEIGQWAIWGYTEV